VGYLFLYRPGSSVSDFYGGTSHRFPGAQFYEWGFVDQRSLSASAIIRRWSPTPVYLAFAARHRDVYGAQRAAGDSYRVDDGMLMTRKLPGMHIYRAIFYLPAIVGGVADGADQVVGLPARFFGI